jgi:predicted TIM-barrel fold metal-dependent hydrolase
VHFGGGMSGHIKLAGGRFFDWIAAGKRVYTDLSWAIGFAPRWLAAEIERRGLGHDRVLFASDQPWGDYAGEHARTAAALAGSELQARVFRDTFAALYD